jgi:hypothetical protein
MSTNVRSNGDVVQLDRRPEPDENVTEKAVADPPSLARFVLRLFRAVSTLHRRWWPRRVDFEDQAVDATGLTVYDFPHNFNGRVRWWLVDWSSADFVAPTLVRYTTTDDNTLRLISYVAGTATIRVEEAG